MSPTRAVVKVTMTNFLQLGTSSLGVQLRFRVVLYNMSSSSDKCHDFMSACYSEEIEEADEEGRGEEGFADDGNDELLSWISFRLKIKLTFLVRDDSKLQRKLHQCIPILGPCFLEHSRDDTVHSSWKPRIQKQGQVLW